MRVWDVHCHPDEPRIEGKTLAEKVESIIRTGDRLGTERFGCFLRALTVTIGRSSKCSGRTGRVYGCLWMTLWDQSTQSSLALLAPWVRDGPMVGMKLAGTDGVCSLPVHDPCIVHAVKLKAGICLAAGWGDPALGRG